MLCQVKHILTATKKHSPRHTKSITIVITRRVLNLNQEPRLREPYLHSIPKFNAIAIDGSHGMFVVFESDEHALVQEHQHQR